MSILSSNEDQKSLETEFLIFIFLPTGDKWKSKTQFLPIFDLRSSIVKSVLDCLLLDVSSVFYIYLQMVPATTRGRNITKEKSGTMGVIMNVHVRTPRLENTNVITSRFLSYRHVKKMKHVLKYLRT